jgi:Fe-S-cluster containining protein
MEESKDIRFECTHCGNCCIDKNTLVNLTYKDILRIKEGLKLNIDELLEIIGFYVFDKAPTEGELKKMVVPPIQTEKGLAFVGLKKLNDGSCYFFDIENKRCKMYDLRPNFCRTFPFSFRIIVKKNGQANELELYYTNKSIEYCEGISKEAPLIDENEWLKLGKITINDLNDNNILIEKWNESVDKGIISQSAKNFLLTVINLNDDIKRNE